MFTINVKNKMILSTLSSKYKPKIGNCGAANRVTLQNEFDLRFFQNDIERTTTCWNQSVRTNFSRIH